MNQAIATTPDIHRNYVQAMVDYHLSRLEQLRGFGLTKEIILSDYATFGVKPPRQTGGSYWLMTEFIRRPDSIMLVKNQNLRDFFIRRHSGGFHPITGEQYPYLRPGQESQIFTFQEYHERVSDNALFPGREATFIHDAGVFFNRIRHRKFYDWLVKYVGYDHLVFTLN